MSKFELSSDSESSNGDYYKIDKNKDDYNLIPEPYSLKSMLENRKTEEKEHIINNSEILDLGKKILKDINDDSKEKDIYYKFNIDFLDILTFKKYDEVVLNQEIDDISFDSKISNENLVKIVSNIHSFDEYNINCFVEYILSSLDNFKISFLRFISYFRVVLLEKPKNIGYLILFIRKNTIIDFDKNIMDILLIMFHCLISDSCLKFHYFIEQNFLEIIYSDMFDLNSFFNIIKGYSHVFISRFISMLSVTYATKDITKRILIKFVTYYYNIDPNSDLETIFSCSSNLPVLMKTFDFHISHITLIYDKLILISILEKDNNINSYIDTLIENYRFSIVGEEQINLYAVKEVLHITRVQCELIKNYVIENSNNK